MFFRTEDDKTEFKKNCVTRCKGHSDLALYQGCYVDKDQRDLPIRIGGENHMVPEDCFRQAKKEGYGEAG